MNNSLGFYKFKNAISTPITGLLYGIIVLFYQVIYVIVPLRMEISGSSLSLISPLLAIAGLFLLIMTLLTDPERFVRREMLIPWLMILVLCVTTVLNWDKSLVDNIKTIIWQGNLLLLIFSSCISIGESTKERFDINNKTAVVRIARIAILLLLLIWDIAIIVSLVQYYDLVYYRVTSTEGFINQGVNGGRLFGVFITPYKSALLSLYMLVASALCLMMIEGRIRYFYLLSFFLSVTMIVLSGTRSVLLGMLSASLIIISMFFSDCIFKNRITKPVFCILVSVLVAIAVTLFIGLMLLEYGNALKNSARMIDREKVQIIEQNSGYDLLERSDVNRENISNNRFYIWYDYMQIFAEEPRIMLLGYSPCGFMEYISANYPDRYIVKYYHDNKPYEYYCRHEIYDPHNTPILVLISTGLVGLILLLVLVFYTLKRIFVYYRAGRFRVADYCALAVLITTFTAIMFESDIFYLCNTTSLVFWMTLGFVLGRTEQTVKTQH